MPAERSVLVRLRADISDFNAKILAASGTARGFADSLNSSNNRMTALTQSALALGPALIPIAAGASVAVTALGTSLGFAAAGAGVAALAFDGVGDALKALDKAQLDPTSTNIAAFEKTLVSLGPAAQNFVIELDKLEPRLKQLRETAQSGVLPGVGKGISEIEQSFPQVRVIVAELANTIGDLAAEGGAALQSPFWHDFLAQFGVNASQALSDMSRGIGDVIEGLAGMFEAFEPVGRDFDAELLHLAQEFRDWGEGLSHNTGFQQFIDYVRTEGPQAWQTLGSLADALLAVVKAAAPVGSASLPVIRALADVLRDIADSPAGPVILGAAAALSALSRAIAVFRAINGASVLTAIRGGGSGLSKTAAASGQAAAQASALRSGLGVAGLLGVAASQEIPETNKALRDLAQTASYTAVGFSLGGPLGAALGGFLGVVQSGVGDIDDLSDAMTQLHAVTSSSSVDLAGQANAIGNLATANQAFFDKTEAGEKGFFKGIETFNPAKIVGGISASIGDLWDRATGKSKQAIDQVHQAIEMLGQSSDELTQFRQAALGVPQGGLIGALVADSPADTARLTQFANHAIAILQNVGYTIPRIKQLLATPAGRVQLAGAIRDYTASLDSVPGRTQAVATAIKGLDSTMTDAATKASDLQTALDDLIGPGLNLTAAIDTWQQGLNDLGKNLSKSTHSIVGNSDAVIANRNAIRSQVQDMIAVAKAAAANGEGSEALRKRLLGMYDALVKTASGLGINKTALGHLLTAMGLSPTDIDRMVGALNKGKQSSDDLTHSMKGIPKQVSPHIQIPGIDTLDQKVRNLNADMDSLHDVSVSVTVTRINKVLDELHKMNGGLVDYYAGGGIENHVAQIAPAGSWRVWAEPETGGEAYIPLHPGKRQRSRSIAEETVSRLGGLVSWMADGGLTGRVSSNATTITVRTNDSAVIDRLERIEAALGGDLRARVVNPGEVAAGVQRAAETVTSSRAATDMRRSRMGG